MNSTPNNPAPDWQAIAMENARLLQAAREERNEALDAAASAECERDALRRELRLANLAEDGTQRANTPAARVLTLQPANHRTAAARAAREASPRFIVGHGAPCTLAELIRANPDDEALHAWARGAAIGASFPDGEGCERIA